MVHETLPVLGSAFQRAGSFQVLSLGCQPLRLNYGLMREHMERENDSPYGKELRYPGDSQDQGTRRVAEVISDIPAPESNQMTCGLNAAL